MNHLQLVISFPRCCGRYQCNGASTGQHGWDEATFRQHAEAKLLKSKDLTERQRDQTMELMLKLWVKGRLDQLDYEYDIEVERWQNPV